MKNKKYTCKNCKKTNESVGIVQTEKHYYSLNLNTKKWEDFHGDDSCELQKLFCLNCAKRINRKEIGVLDF
ncbi:MAG: hypothetical protein NTV03_00980 [Candidatus Nomurabacteria bacterium]|nr:hypothetical protein [Candidatus Nomurabacteria bacterium]